MIEVLDGRVAAALVPNYDPDCRYELETDADGLYVISTDTETGESTYIRLGCEEERDAPLTPLWDEDAISAQMRDYKAKRVRNVILSICGVALLVIVSVLLIK